MDSNLVPTSAESETYYQRQRRHQRELDERRKQSGATEVDLHRVPNWFRKRVLKAFGSRHRCTSGASMIDVLRSRNGNWIDHHGTSKHSDGRQTFVSEPYGLSDETLAYIQALAIELECTVVTSPVSWWNPGATTRIEFFEIEMVAGSPGSSRRKSRARPAISNKELQALNKARKCFVCLGDIPEGQGVYQSWFNFLTHQDACANFVTKVENGSLGRWRTRTGFLRLIIEHRDCASQSGTH